MIEALNHEPRWEIVGLLDADPALVGRRILGIPVLGDDGYLEQVAARGVHHFFIGVGSVGDASVRRRLYTMAVERGMTAVVVVHPRAVVSPSAVIGPGTAVLAQAVVNAGALLGVNVIVNTGAIIEHDCVVEDHAHVATGARLASTVRVGRGAHVGAGATVRQRISIGEAAVVGIGAAVVADVPAKGVVVGVPARRLTR